MAYRGVIKKLSFILTLSTLLLYITPFLWAEESGGHSDRGNVTIIVMDRMSLQDLVEAQTPNMMTLISKGAVGLMTTNTASGASKSSQNTYATIGAGAKVEAGYPGGLAFNGTEWRIEKNLSAAKQYELRTGVKPEKENVIHLGIAEVWHRNKDLKYNFVIGALGTALHEADIKTAVLGNSDDGEYYYRQAAIIAMDSIGMIDYGDVSSNLLIKDQSYVFGRRTNYDKMIEYYQDFESKAGLIVLDLGDLARLDQEFASLLPEIFEEKKKDIIRRYDEFVGSIGALTDFEKDLLIILSPSPSALAMEERNFLTPVIVAGKGIEPGLLWSPTTKRDGLINNTDIVPTVLNHFGLPAQIPLNGQLIPLSGQAVQTIQADKPVDRLLEMNNQIVHTYNARAPLVKGFINLALILVVLSAIGIYLNLEKLKHVRFLMAAVIAAPLAMLLQYFIPHLHIVVTVLSVVVLSVALAALSYIGNRVFRDGYAFFSIIGLTTAGIIIIDTLLGGALNKNSPLSYDPMAGARFYGIGNEYMGVLIGALLMGLGSLPGELTRGRKIIFGLVMAITTLVMIAPNLGTNVGGTIASLVGFATVGLLVTEARLNWKMFIGVIAGLGLIFVGFLLFDLTRSPEQQSHIGRTINLLLGGGFNEALQIIARKWEVNWRLIKGTTWSWTYFSALISIVLINHWLKEKVRLLDKQRSVFVKFQKGIIAASVGALLFNDSGVVAAAIMILYAVFPMMYFLMGQKDL